MTDQESVEDRNMHIRLSLVARQGPANISFRPADRSSQTDALYGCTEIKCGKAARQKLCL